MRRLTVVYLQPTAYAVPKRKIKDKLVAYSRVKEIVFGEDHDERVVTGKILKHFPNLLSKDNSPPFRYMHASSTGDIICAELPKSHSGWDGDAVCSIAEGSNVYLHQAGLHSHFWTEHGSWPFPTHYSYPCSWAGAFESKWSPSLVPRPSVNTEGGSGEYSTKYLNTVEFWR